MSPLYSEEERAAFWEKVDCSNPDGCWTWLRALNGEGRGRHTLRGHTRYAYVYALILTGTDVQPGTQVRHLCNTPSCCRPDHLSTVGGQRANNQDTVAAGHHASAVLTAEDARQIRERLAGPLPPSQIELAAEYGVSPSSISSAATGKTFPEAGGPLKPSRKGRAPPHPTRWTG